MRSPASPSSKRIAAVFEMIDVYAHDHRHAARPRENGDMAARTSPAQYQAAVAPVIGQKHGRRHIVGRDDDAWPARSDRLHPRDAAARDRAGRANRRHGRGNRDLPPPRRRRFPDRSPHSRPGWRPRRRRCSANPGADKIIVFEKRNLERENRLRIGVLDFAGERGKICPATPRAHRQGPDAPPPEIAFDGYQASRQPNASAVQAQFRGGRPPFDATGRSMRSIVHPENLRRPASPALPMRPSRRSPRRENKSSNPSAPWSP